ncbi:MAG: cytochrome b N-terminal domain-containing protein [Deltaproteobacteria bacterium]|jgi:quinol-cytochrome oxidoreductase complex cytochrome b subunit|nr:cytochrome b N-terminal domain-containing protein [Deltaproteobacteria bacterium]
MNLGQKIYNWLEDRLGVKSSLTGWLRSPVAPTWTNWLYCFGGLTFLVLLLQLLSGIYLAMFYQPAPAGAWTSIEFIEKSVWLGKFCRSLHRWGAFVMMFFLIIHVLRVIYHGAYRAPRELNWICGVLLLLLAAAFVVTGYLLPWDFRAYWTVKTIGNWIEQLPLFGDTLKWLLFTDTPNGIVPVGRWFFIHTLVLPLLTGVFLAGHFLMVRRHGVTRPM